MLFIASQSLLGHLYIFFTYMFCCLRIDNSTRVLESVPNVFHWGLHQCFLILLFGLLFLHAYCMFVAADTMICICKWDIERSVGIQGRFFMVWKCNMWNVKGKQGTACIDGCQEWLFSYLRINHLSQWGDWGGNSIFCQKNWSFGKIRHSRKDI